MVSKQGSVYGLILFKTYSTWHIMTQDIWLSTDSLGPTLSHSWSTGLLPDMQLDPSFPNLQNAKGPCLVMREGPGCDRVLRAVGMGGLLHWGYY